MRMREKILAYGSGTVGLIIVIVVLTVWAGAMGCILRTGDGDVCVAIAQAMVHRDTPTSRTIVATYLNTDWLGRPRGR